MGLPTTIIQLKVEWEDSDIELCGTRKQPCEKWWRLFVRNIHNQLQIIAAWLESK